LATIREEKPWTYTTDLSWERGPSLRFNAVIGAVIAASENAGLFRV
jgi:hypothetical protein